MSDSPASSPVATADHRVLLLDELYNRYGRSTGGAGRLMQRLRFLRKKYAWVLIVGGAKFIKRSMDILVSLAALVMLLPLFLGVALFIKLTDWGPILFWQVRVGRWGREFPFPKFRSMVINAEAIKDKLLAQNDHLQKIKGLLDGFLGPRQSVVAPEELSQFLQENGQVVPQEKVREFYDREGRIVDSTKLLEFLTLTFKMKNDPRITWIGRIIRKLSIDELPQLWCVLKGDMSLVGPRPPVPREVEKYTLADRRRLDGKPGLTCIWQVSGRGDVPFPMQVELDKTYLESQSVWLDIKILLRTVPAVLLGKGAY